MKLDNVTLPVYSSASRVSPWKTIVKEPKQSENKVWVFQTQQYLALYWNDS